MPTVRSSCSFLVIIITLMPIGIAVAVPPISDEITLDHGFRYHDPNDCHFGCALAVCDDRMLFSWGSDTYEGEGWSIPGIQHELFGGFIGIRPTSLVSGGRYGEYALSGPDGEGLKLAYQKREEHHGPNGVYIRNFDRSNLVSTGDEVELQALTTDAIDHVTATFTGNHHLIAWIQEVGGNWRLVLCAVNPDLSIVPPGAIGIAGTPSSERIAVCGDVAGGLLGYLSSTGEIMVRPLTATGIPAGDEVPIATVAEIDHGHIALEPLGANWLIAWSSSLESPKYAVLNRAGEILPPGVIDLGVGHAYEGLAMAQSPTMNCVAWRGGDGGLYTARIDLDGGLMQGDPRLLSAWDYFINEFGTQNRCNIDCEWTGEHFVIEWVNWWEPWFEDPDFPALAQWIGIDGEPALASPKVLNRGSRPWSFGIALNGERILAVIHDAYNRERLHACVADLSGTMLQDPLPYSPLWADNAVLNGHVESRLIDDGVGLIYYWDYWEESGANEELISIASFDFAGSLTSLFDCHIGVIEDPAHPHDFDAVVTGTPLCAYDTYMDPPDPRETVVRLDYSREWRVSSTGSGSEEPTVLCIGDAYLLVWSEVHGEDTYLFRGVADPQEPGSLIEGVPLHDVPSQQSDPYLALGPDQNLCVFSMSYPGASTSRDIYALRMAPDGTPLDPAPIQVSAALGDEIGPKAIWDGCNYLITWMTAGDELHGGRLSSAGEILDDGGFLIDGYAYSWDAALATDGQGLAAVGYQGNRIRIIDDRGSASAEMVPPDFARILSRPYPNPASFRTEIRLEHLLGGDLSAEIVDASGRRVAVPSIERHAFGSAISWDCALASGAGAPAGTYFMHVRCGGYYGTRKVIVIR